jgi:hypothetical protein
MAESEKILVFHHPERSEGSNWSVSTHPAEVDPSLRSG